MTKTRKLRDDGRRWVNISLAAYLYGCSLNTMRSMADKGFVNVKWTPGKHRRIDRDSIEGTAHQDVDRAIALEILKGMGTS
jgi:hypothetical protein